LSLTAGVDLRGEGMTGVFERVGSFPFCAGLGLRAGTLKYESGDVSCSGVFALGARDLRRPGVGVGSLRIFCLECCCFLAWLNRCDCTASATAYCWQMNRSESSAGSLKLGRLQKVTLLAFSHREISARLVSTILAVERLQEAIGLVSPRISSNGQTFMA
jgi:hypothetical protein